MFQYTQIQSPRIVHFNLWRALKEKEVGFVVAPNAVAVIHISDVQIALGVEDVQQQVVMLLK